MKILIKLEEAGLFLLSVYLFSTLSYSWWLFPLLLLVPDLSMIGYIRNTVAGAYIYNIFHHRGIAVLIFLSGTYFNNEILLLSGIILFAHSTMDRIFGYGLKYSTSFKSTHLGEIG